MKDQAKSIHSRLSARQQTNLTGVPEPRKVSPELAARYRRRLSSPSSLAPSPASKTIQALAVIASVGATTYTVLYQDFGYEDHCFQPIRRWYHARLNSLFTLSDKEKMELREQGKL